MAKPRKNGRAKQSTRMLKCECIECGYTVRTARTWLERVGPPHCPAHGAMQATDLDREAWEENDWQRRDARSASRSRRGVMMQFHKCSGCQKIIARAGAVCGSCGHENYRDHLKVAAEPF